nr:DNA-protecting protein DprA [Microbacterium sp. CH12i]
MLRGRSNAPIVFPTQTTTRILHRMQYRGEIAIVGARAATPYGEHMASELAGDLAATGTLIVSGGAYGIDGTAHRAALGVGGATVAFLAGGVDRAYPSGHQQLFEKIRGGGAVLSEVPCGTAPTKWRFLSRNRLIAALGGATVVVEAGWRSGSLNTAGHAAALGRPLGAVPGPVTSAASAGCHRLMREYDARCVTNAEEVRELLGLDAKDVTAEERRDPDQIRVLDALSARTARAPRDLARTAGLSEERVAAMLGLLSLDGTAIRTSAGWRLAAVD